MLVFLLSVALIITSLGETFVVAQGGLGSVWIAGSYAGAIWLLRKYDKSSDWVPVDLPDPDPLTFRAPTGLSLASNAALERALSV